MPLPPVEFDWYRFGWDYIEKIVVGWATHPHSKLWTVAEWLKSNEVVAEQEIQRRLADGQDDEYSRGIRDCCQCELIRLPK